MFAGLQIKKYVGFLRIILKYFKGGFKGPIALSVMKILSGGIATSVSLQFLHSKRP